jgi:hypothetical protein
MTTIEPEPNVIFVYFACEESRGYERSTGKYGYSLREIAPGIHGIKWNSSSYQKNADGIWENKKHGTGTGNFERVFDNGIVVNIPREWWDNLKPVKYD